MGLNDTASADRIHIGFFGKRNAGKSSLVNAVTGQQLSVVSEVSGTTTDPVRKSMELLPLGPVVIIDTPGFDDVGTLGKERVKTTKRVLNTVDIAVLVTSANEALSECDKELIAIFEQKCVPYIIALNKADLLTKKENRENSLYVSALTGEGIQELKEALGKKAPSDSGKRIVSDVIKPSDFVVLVTPIDSAAPKGRLILPQQQTLRDILDSDAIAVVTKETELTKTLSGLSEKPSLVITDSQAFERVSADTPEDIKLTSFSILMARYKGFLETAVSGVVTLDDLQDGDKILIAEGCTHHRQCDDIGTVKIPRWLRNYTGRELIFDTTSGREFSEDLSEYKLIIHCGGCMLTEREVQSRMKDALDAGIPITNYGILIAYIQGILKRSLEVFPDIAAML